MSDLIDRQAAIDAIEKLDIPEDMCVFEILSHIELAIGTLPSVDAVLVTRCKDCKHRPVRPEDAYYYEDILFQDEECPCICADPYYSWTPEDDWFCPKGERKEE